MTDPYAALGVSATATQAEITQAYRRKLRAHHPDVQSTAPSSGADERVRQIIAAYALLRDPRRRADYDRTANQPHKHTRPVRISVKFDVRIL
jgi:curved DNA-binding protein CbpA